MINRRGERWLKEDAINLVELRAKGATWEFTAVSLGRSVNACKSRYGMLRFADMLRDSFGTIHDNLLPPANRKKRE